MAHGKTFFTAAQAKWQVWALLVVIAGSVLTAAYAVVETFWG